MSSSFSEFVSSLFTELACGYPRLTKRISPSVTSATAVPYEAILVLELAGAGILQLSVSAVNHDLKEARIFQLQLTEAVLTAHMEDDIGICDDSGIRSFGPRFAAALKKDLYYDPGAIVDSEVSGDLSLHVTYDIADFRAETMLLLPLLQGHLHENVFQLLVPTELFSTNLLISGSHSTNNNVSTAVSSVALGIAPVKEEEGGASFSSEEAAAAVTYVHQPEAAKRRKGGGVKLLTNGRRR